MTHLGVSLEYEILANLVQSMIYYMGGHVQFDNLGFKASEQTSSFSW